MICKVMDNLVLSIEYENLNMKHIPRMLIT